MPLIRLIFTICSLLLCRLVLAHEPIATDRPDFVESSEVVGQGRVQIETSVALERNNVAGVLSRTRSTPTLLRLGLSENLELRLETEGAVRQRTSESGVTTIERGYSDLALGLKWHVSEGDPESGKPGTAWLLHVESDSGSTPLRGEGLRPSLRFVAEWALPQGFSLGFMPGIYADRNDRHARYIGGILALTLGKSLTENLHGFAELSGQRLAAAKNGGKLLTFDTGLSYLLSESTQIDAALSRGLNHQSPELQYTFGLSRKF